MPVHPRTTPNLGVNPLSILGLGGAAAGYHLGRRETPGRLSPFAAIGATIAGAAINILGSAVLAAFTGPPAARRPFGSAVREAFVEQVPIFSCAKPKPTRDRRHSRKHWDPTTE